MKLHLRPSLVTKVSKRLGRGYGSGKGGHTSGRGTKGQKARGKIPAHFIGTSWVWFKRLPFIRGKSRFNSIRKTLTIDLAMLTRLKASSRVNAETLYQAGLITLADKTRAKIKVVGSGPIAKKLILEIPASQAAGQAVIKAGGELKPK